MLSARFLHLALPMAVLFGACADERVTGSTTQTENTVVARSVLVDSVLPAWNRPGWTPTVATLRFDSSNFDFTSTDSAGRDLDVRTLDGDPVPFDIAGWDRKARLGRLEVRIDRELLLPFARFNVLRSNILRTRVAPATLWVAIPDSQKLAINSILFDDFEGTSLTSKLPTGSSWYSVASDSTVTVSAPGLVAAGAGRGGKAIHITYSVPSNTGKYALVGIALISGGAPCRLRSLDSVVFSVRGSGKLSLALDRLLLGNPGKAWSHYTLDSNWVRIRIRPQDFDAADGIGNNIGWNAVRDSITNLTFLVSGGSNLYVDDVRFYGVDRDDLK